MPTIVDARGKACPQPVILARKALAEDPEVTVVVDNAAARENVAGMARGQGHTVRIEEQADGTYVHITRGAGGATVPPGVAAAPQGGPVGPSSGPTVLLISADGVGRGEEELGRILMRSLMHTLTESATCAEVLIFVNTGVRLVAEGSPVLDDLRQLEQRGVQLLACGTCLSYLELKDRVAVGAVSNMYSILETLLGASKVITI